MNNIYGLLFLAPLRLMLNNVPAEARTALYWSLVPAALVAVTCTGVLMVRRKSRDGYWYSALAILLFLLLKVGTLWIIEPYVLMAPLFGSWGGRMLTLGILIPEGFIFPRYLEKGAGMGAPYLQLATYCAPLGSILIGTLIGFSFGKRTVK